MGMNWDNMQASKTETDYRSSSENFEKLSGKHPWWIAISKEFLFDNFIKIRPHQRCFSGKFSKLSGRLFLYRRLDLNLQTFLKVSTLSCCTSSNPKNQFFYCKVWWSCDIFTKYIYIIYTLFSSMLIFISNELSKLSNNEGIKAVREGYDNHPTKKVAAKVKVLLSFSITFLTS